MSLDYFQFKKINQLSYPEEIVNPKYNDPDEVVSSIYLGIFSLIVSHPKLGVTIDQLYSKNRSKYAKKASNHAYYDVINNCGSFVGNIERGIKLLGLYLVEGDKVLFELIKKGWPTYFNAFRKMYVEEDISLLVKLQKCADGENLDDSIAIGMLAQYFGFIGSNDPDTFCDDFPFFQIEEYRKIFLPLAFSFKNNTLNDKGQKKIREELTTRLGLDKKNIRKIWTYFEEIKDVRLLSCIEIGSTKAKLNPWCVLKSELDKDTMESILQTVIEIYPDFDTVGKNELYLAICFLMFITVLVKEYNGLKERYFDLKKEKDTQTLQTKVKEAKKESKAAKTELSRKEKRILELERQLEVEQKRNRKIETDREQIISQSAKQLETDFSRREEKLKEEVQMLREMLEDSLSQKQQTLKNESKSFEYLLDVVKQTPNILYVCNDETGAATSKIRKFKDYTKNIKFFTKSSDPVPSSIDYIFFDYHLISHGMYYKIKQIGKRRNIPMYNTQEIDFEGNIEEMANYILNNLSKE